MTSLPAICMLGFLLGMRHATDPDHVVAVTTIVSRHRTTKDAALIGVLWGLGHTLTILAVGTGIILLGWIIPPRVGLSLELAVGVMLIVLGLMNLSGARQRTAAAVTSPVAAGTEHVHIPRARLEHWLGRLGFYQSLRPLLVGVVHGLAGSAAVALLVLTTIGNTRWAIVYLLVFGIGTAAGMMLISAGIAWPLARAGARYAQLPQKLRITSGLASLMLGLALAYQIGIVDGLFVADTRWTPR